MDDLEIIHDEQEYLEYSRRKPKILNYRKQVKFYCSVCNNESIICFRALQFPFICKSCKLKLKSKTANEKRKKTTFEKYGVENVFQDNSVKNKIKTTCIERYGVEYISQSDEFKDQVKNTNIKNYGVPYLMQSDILKEKSKNSCIDKYGVDNVSKSNVIQDKIKQTCIEKYGVPNAFQNKDIQEKQRQTCFKKYGVNNIGELKSTVERRKKTMFDRYGVEYATQNHEFFVKGRQKYTYNGIKFDSIPELAYYIWLTDNNIKFEYQPDIKFNYVFNGETHFYHPDFIVDNKILELKGPQFFEDCDYNKRMVNPFDHNMDELFEAKHQCMIANNVRIMTDIEYMKYIDYVNQKYTPDFLPLFKGNTEFPYPNQKLDDKSDIGLIRHFHKSIYHANRQNEISPYDAWQNKDLVLKSALNRLKYKGICTPEAIIQGFNIAKIAPKVSVFRPTLATRLVQKYLNEYKVIFDPFSGFSGRLIGTVNNGKIYIGHDINQTHVDESNALIDYKKYPNCTVIQKDIFDDTGTYDCLFTCPPYSLKEIWNKNETNMDCDMWINECILRYKCEKYLFVVDHTEKYVNNIVETIRNKSHFGENTEYIILI